MKRVTTWVKRVTTWVMEHTVLSIVALIQVSFWLAFFSTWSWMTGFPCEYCDWTFGAEEAVDR